MSREPCVSSICPCAVQGSRHDAQVAVFGRSVQAKLEAQRLFLVGAGALGCEFLKVRPCGLTTWEAWNAVHFSPCMLLTQPCML